MARHAVVDSAGIASPETGERGEQHRRRHAVGVGRPLSIDPGDLAKQAHDGQDRQHDADRQNAENQAVEAGIGHEGADDLAIEDQRDEARQRQEQDHANEKDLRI